METLHLRIWYPRGYDPVQPDAAPTDTATFHTGLSGCNAFFGGKEPSITRAASTKPAPADLSETSRPIFDDISCPVVTRSILRAAEGGESAIWSGFPGVDTQDELYIPLVTYTVRGDTISEPVLADVPDKLLRYQDDTASQNLAWDLFTTLIPLEQRAMLAQFQIVTDGLGGVLSAVEQTAEDPRTWALEVDIADVPDINNLTFTLLHEFGHLLT